MSSRALAMSVLLEVESGRRLDVAWEASGAPRLPERAWLRHLIYGTVRLQGRLDHILSRHLSRPLASLDPAVRAALRLGAHQILEMHGVPAYAAVSESVDLVKGGPSRAAAGLVNAVLRRIDRERPSEPSFPDPRTDLEGYLTAWGSHPRWLVRRWIGNFGPGGARALVGANNREPDICLRPVGATVEEAEAALVRAGLADAVELPEDCGGPSVSSGNHGPPDECGPARTHGPGRNGRTWIRLRRGTDPGEALTVVGGVIQDPAASLVVDYAAVPPGALVADLCAAPGGKALALSADASGVVAVDLSPRRLARVADGVRRTGAAVWPVAADARFPPVETADVVLVDAPCSGTGTIRRHPDGRWRLRESDVARLADVQRSILEGAASAVPRGGLLVYATCALEPEENQVQVKRFLARHPDFRIEPAAVPDAFLDGQGCLVVLPPESGFDGAFAARMRRA